jgi:hypothetical protein
MNLNVLTPAINWEALRQTLWHSVRRPARVEDALLLRDTRSWLAALPFGLRPRMLPQRYPRIANELSRLWNQHDQLLAYFNDLLVDKRGDRQGFDPLIQEELQAMFAYCVKRKVSCIARAPTLGRDQMVVEAV